MKTLPATLMGLSETHNLEFNPQKSERETLVVLKKSFLKDEYPASAVD
jgi:hypothetical protein